MKYASLSLITLSFLGAFAIGCSNSRPHTTDNDVGPTPTTDMGPGNDSGPTPGNDTGPLTRDMGTIAHDMGPTPPHDSGSTHMCTPSCTSDAQCAGTCPPAGTGASNCCMAGHCYVSRTATCPAPMGHDSGAGGSGGG